MKPWLYEAQLAIKRKFATPFFRRLLRRPTYSATRGRIAARYLHGDGIEIGALNQPMLPLNDTRVRYVDSKPIEVLHDSHVGLGFMQPPDIIADFESLCGIADSSQNFVIANHVLEHLENPLAALSSTARVLVPGGVAFIALPDKERTFDRLRQVTTLKHLIRDFEDGPHWSRRAHYVDWAQNVERCKPAMLRDRVAELERARADIHFHVWDAPAMATLFAHAEGMTGLSVVESERNRGELIWVLRKA
jgi:SAM-dependent methyltransferase